MLLWDIQRKYKWQENLYTKYKEKYTLLVCCSTIPSRLCMCVYDYVHQMSLIIVERVHGKNKLKLKLKYCQEFVCNSLCDNFHAFHWNINYMKQSKVLQFVSTWNKCSYWVRSIIYERDVLVKHRHRCNNFSVLNMVTVDHRLSCCMVCAVDSAASERERRQKTNEPVWYWRLSSGIRSYVLVGVCARSTFSEALEVECQNITKS